MTKARFLVLGCCLIGLAAGQAEAGVITFDEIGSYSITHFESGGFVFKDTAADAHIAKFPGCTPTCPSNGTNILINPHGSPAEGETSAVIEMSAVGGDMFALTSFEGAGAFNFNEVGRPDAIPSQIDVVGIRFDGTKVTQSFLIDKSASSGPLSFTNYTLSSSFANLTLVTFSSSGSSIADLNGLSLDNIVATTAPVPEPETYMLLIVGLGVVLGVARRGKGV